MLKVESMRKKTTLVDSVLCALVYVNGNKTNNIDKFKVGLTLRYH